MTVMDADGDESGGRGQSHDRRSRGRRGIGRHVPGGGAADFEQRRADCADARDAPRRRSCRGASARCAGRARSKAAGHRAGRAHRGEHLLGFGHRPRLERRGESQRQADDDAPCVALRVHRLATVRALVQVRP